MGSLEIQIYMCIQNVLFHDSGYTLKIIHTQVNSPFQIGTAAGIGNRLSQEHTHLSKQVQNQDEVLQIAPLDQLAA